MHKIEELIKTFSGHALEVEEMRQKAIESFKKENPDKALPTHLAEDFNFPGALKCICEEIVELKEKLKVEV